MTDKLDQAKALEMTHRQRCLDEVLNRQSEPPQQIIDGAVRCIDCGAAIEPARLNAKPEAARCIRCQHAEETHGRYR